MTLLPLPLPLICAALVYTGLSLPAPVPAPDSPPAAPVSGTQSPAAGRPARAGFWGAIDVGAGRARREGPGLAETRTRFYASFVLGYTVHPRFVAGLDVGGWLIEPGNSFLEPQTRGEAVMKVFGTARWYPFASSGLHVRGGWGWLDHWKQEPAFATRVYGPGGDAGIGYDVTSRGWPFSITPHLLYTTGHTGSQSFHAWTAGLGVTWH